MNFLGIGSGLDLSTMLDGLVQVASQPKVQQLGRREVQLEDSLSGLGMLKSALSDFQDSVDALKDGDLFTKMVPTINQPSSGDLIDVNAGDSAVASSYDIEVVSLAEGSKATSDWRSVKYQSDFFEDTSSDIGLTGTLDFGGGNSVAVSATDSLSDIKGKIDGLGGSIGARIVDGRLEYYANGTGETLTVSSTGDAGLSIFTTAGDMTVRAESSKDANLSGTLSFTADGNSFDVTLAGDESLDDIVSIINSSEDNFGITANVIDGKLVYQSSITGAGNDLSVTGISELSTTGNMSIAAGDVAKDAEIKVDGVSIKNDTNVFDSAISGLTITAKKESVSGETAGVTIGTSSSEVKSNIDAFAAAYNKLREQMNELKGTTDEEGNFIAGKLTNDPIVRNVESVLNGFITKQVPGISDGFDTLYSIGLEIESDGTLKTDSSRLSDALDNMDSLQVLFAGSGNVSDEGLGDELSDALENFVSFTGVIKGKEDSVQQQLDDLDDQYEAHARYIESYQKTLQQQFTALDATMAQMNSVMQYIGPQLAALPGVAK